MAAPSVTGALREVRCEFCKRLLFMARGGGTEVQVKCKCDRLVTLRPDAMKGTGPVRIGA